MMKLTKQQILNIVELRDEGIIYNNILFIKAKDNNYYMFAMNVKNTIFYKTPGAFLRGKTPHNNTQGGGK